MIVAQLAPFVLFVRIAAAVGGAIVGYFLAGPVLHLLFRLAFHRSVPGWLRPIGKLGGAALIGALFFYIVTLGGSDLWGFGAGPGGVPGAGPGPGSGNIGSDKSKAGKGDVNVKAREKLEIELLGGKRFPGEGRYYLVQGEPTAKTIDEIEDVIKVKADKLEVHVMLTDDSVAAAHPASRRLRDLLQRYEVPTVMPTEK